MRQLYFIGGALLLSLAARAQQPVLPSAPQPGQPTPAPRTAALPQAEVIGHPGEVIGQTYSVETVGGTQFSGTLQAATEETLTFQTRELGVVTIQRVNLRQLMSQTPEQVRRGFDYVGNGTRMFIAPTARNLHQGEGTVDVINIFLIGASYGITDNISLGLYAPVIPAVGIPVVALTPKVSVPITDKLHVGAGLYYAFGTGIAGASGSGGAGFGLATYGTADNNITFGLGYGVGSEGIGRTPVGMIGANVRLSRLFSVVNETYIADIGGFGGLAGFRYASPRFNAGLGVLYFTSGSNGGVYPAYLSAAYRFGKIRLR